MPKCVIDGREVEFTPGENMIEVAQKVGDRNPVFLLPPGNVASSLNAECARWKSRRCRSFKRHARRPRPTAWSIKTKSERVIKNQKSVMEFLLINHPLDCPICDKSGECDLQDFSFKYGDAYSRYTEERRTYMDLDMGPVIKKNMNRCIHCTRCIRFGAEVADIHEMVAVQRGNNTEITTIDGRPLETDYAGNYADICPTGSLTLKDFRFRKRAWYLKKTADRLRRLLQGLQHGDSSGRKRRFIAAFRARTWRSTSIGSATRAASISTMFTTRTAWPIRMVRARQNRTGSSGIDAAKAALGRQEDHGSRGIRSDAGRGKAPFRTLFRQSSSGCGAVSFWNSWHRLCCRRRARGQDSQAKEQDLESQWS